MIEKDAIRNTCFWDHVPLFVKKNVELKVERYIILGYFPYHTACIRRRLHRNFTPFPRTFLEDFENILIKNGMQDNKSVYICESSADAVGEHKRWAVMLKDDWAIIGNWEEVTDYEGKPLKHTK